MITEVQLAQVLANSLSLATVDLTQVQVDWSAVHMLRARFCEQHELFPFAIDGKGTANKKLLVAMSDPLNRAATEEIEFTTGLPVASYVSTHGQVRSAILRESFNADVVCVTPFAATVVYWARRLSTSTTSCMDSTRAGSTRSPAPMTCSMRHPSDTQGCAPGKCVPTLSTTVAL